MNSLSDLISDRDDDFVSSPTIDAAQTGADAVPGEPDQDAVDLDQLKAMVYSMKDQLDSIIRTIGGEKIRHLKISDPEAKNLETGERIIEGVFNGEKMVGSDGREYSVAPNYASKSKLVEGDILKLTITNKGSFVYKQIGPIERKRVVGELVSDPDTGQWSVLVGGKTYKVLSASVTFYKGKAGDEAVVLVPQSGESGWGALENIISK